MHDSRIKFPLVAVAVTYLIAAGSLPAALVAYFPITNSDTNLFIDDVIDDPTHGVADGIGNNNGGASIIFDSARGGFVASTVNGHRYTAGTQDIDLSLGFTWSLWVKSDSFNNLAVGSGGGDPNGADVIIGSRDGSWNKIQAQGSARFFDHSYNVDDDTWHHIVYTGVSTGLDSELSNFWVDGIKVSTDSNGSINNLQVETTKLEIGGASRFTEDWAGLFDDVAIWNEVISDADIAALYAGADPTTIAIPEPGALMLGTLGMLLLLLRRGHCAD